MENCLQITASFKMRSVLVLVVVLSGNVLGDWGPLNAKNCGEGKIFIPDLDIDGRDKGETGTFESQEGLNAFVQSISYDLMKEDMLGLEISESDVGLVDRIVNLSNGTVTKLFNRNDERYSFQTFRFDNPKAEMFTIYLDEGFEIIGLENTEFLNKVVQMANRLKDTEFQAQYKSQIQFKEEIKVGPCEAVELSGFAKSSKVVTTFQAEVEIRGKVNGTVLDVPKLIDAIKDYDMEITNYNDEYDAVTVHWTGSTLANVEAGSGVTVNKVDIEPFDTEKVCL